MAGRQGHRSEQILSFCLLITLLKATLHGIHLALSIARFISQSTLYFPWVLLDSKIAFLYVLLLTMCANICSSLLVWATGCSRMCIQNQLKLSKVWPTGQQAFLKIMYAVRKVTDVSHTFNSMPVECWPYLRHPPYGWVTTNAMTKVGNRWQNLPTLINTIDDY